MAREDALSSKRGNYRRRGGRVSMRSRGMATERGKVIHPDTHTGIISTVVGNGLLKRKITIL
jgi:hypothetical protein